MAELTFARYRHAAPPFAIDLPSAFVAGALHGVLLAARAPDGLLSSSPFAPNLTVAALQRDGAESGGDDALAVAAKSFPRWRLLDRAPATVGGMRGERTLATYVAGPSSGVGLADDVVVAVEQWRLDGDGIAWVLSGSSDSADYGQVADLWEMLAASFRVGEA